MKRIALLSLIVLSILMPRLSHQMPRNLCVAASSAAWRWLPLDSHTPSPRPPVLTLPHKKRLYQDTNNRVVASSVGGVVTRRDTTIRFASIHIYLDSGNTPLAAYQFELKTDPERVKIVGVEGGQHPAFKEAPYYDPAALANNRIIIAAFNTGTDLPTGQTRIATVHLQIIGAADPDYELILNTAGNPDGNPIDAELLLQRGKK